ncbi:MAG: hypothetical protein CAPSK01_000689 [Candidatus Accumulibacter vicinus]|uniref:Uncharacterized protein n=1 Tax=Candidatus Accumulibacter vicinus TaxID=2954382 RepID=A0A084Y4I6_9PROT|nr:MAG: hypothetical protein CAPSK01_000689 [Candidatus Accumulibacter vicinus]
MASGGLFAKEHITRVGVQEVVDPARIGSRPLLDACHRSLFEAQLAAVDEYPPDRLIGVAILVGVSQAYRLAIGQPDPPGALHLQKEQFDGVVDVKQNAVKVVLFMSGDFRT